MARDGNNQVLACDPATGKVRRFLTGPVNCALTGATWTPDGRTMFVNIQHPGEMPTGRNDPGRAAPQVQLARLPPALPAALGDAGDPQGRGRGDRDLRAAG